MCLFAILKSVIEKTTSSVHTSGSQDLVCHLQNQNCSQRGRIPRHSSTPELAQGEGNHLKTSSDIYIFMLHLVIIKAHVLKILDK